MDIDTGVSNANGLAELRLLFFIFHPFPVLIFSKMANLWLPWPCFRTSVMCVWNPWFKQLKWTSTKLDFIWFPTAICSLCKSTGSLSSAHITSETFSRKVIKNFLINFWKNLAQRKTSVSIVVDMSETVSYRFFLYQKVNWNNFLVSTLLNNWKHISLELTTP